MSGQYKCIICAKEVPMCLGTNGWLVHPTGAIFLGYEKGGYSGGHSFHHSARICPRCALNFKDCRSTKNNDTTQWVFIHTDLSTIREWQKILGGND
jgi:hypothetical protein